MLFAAVGVALFALAPKPVSQRHTQNKNRKRTLLGMRLMKQSHSQQTEQARGVCGIARVRQTFETGKMR
jgi:hypothetical protein